MEVSTMTRDEVYRDIEETLGLVPSFIRSIPDNYVEEEWNLMKRLQLGETAIPNKYKELMGIAISAATHCRYCTLFHTEAARLFGATDEEIQEAAHFAKMSTGWSAYAHGMQIDYEEFRNDVRRISAHIRQRFQKAAA
jgi:AhpD family alkylhydroperoxidase